MSDDVPTPTPDTDALSLPEPARRTIGALVHGCVSTIALLLAFGVMTPAKAAAVTSNIEPVVIGVAVGFNMLAALWQTRKH